MCIGDDAADESMYTALLEFAGEHVEDVEATNRSSDSAGGVSLFNCTVGKKQSRAQFFVPGVRDVEHMMSILVGMDGKTEEDLVGQTTTISGRLAELSVEEQLKFEQYRTKQAGAL